MRGGGSKIWGQEGALEELLKLQKQGLSCSHIARALSLKFNVDVTRNAVIGKLSRMGIPTLFSTGCRSLNGKLATRKRDRVDGVKTMFGGTRKVWGGKCQMERIREKVSQGLAPKEISQDLGIDHVSSAIYRLNVGAEQHDPILDVAAKPLLELEAGDCRWPVGTPGEKDFGFCARPKTAGLPYCEGHVRRAYQPPDQPRRQFVPFPQSKVKEREDA